MKWSKNQQYWFLHILGWYVFFVLNEFVLNDEVTPLGHLIFISVNPTIGIIITHIYRKRLLSYLQRKQRTLLPWKFIVTGWVIVTLIFGAINTPIAIILLDINGHRLLKPDDIKVLIWFSFMLSTPWFTVYHTYKFAQMAIQRAIEATRLKELLHEAELENLKSQLNPHFLFNALNSIKALTISDPELAREAITKLSDLLRLSLLFGKLESVFVEREMEIVKDYLSLEKIRFDKRLTYSMEISDNAKEILIPPMTIQTLVENAIKHGISQRKQGGAIIIKVELNSSILEISVSNSGRLKKELGGIGLTNLQRRLKIMDPNSQFSITQEDEENVLASIHLNVK